MNITLKNVRLSFPSLFKARAFSSSGNSQGNQQEPKFSATFLLDVKKNAADIKAIKDGIAAALAEVYGNKVPKGFKPCLRSGTEKPETDGYGEGIMFVSASNARRPSVVDRDLTPLTEQDGKPYAGCYVNAVIRLWVQDNAWGKRVNASLSAVQFVKDGEVFGEKPIDPNEVFENLGDDEGGSSEEENLDEDSLV